MAFKALKKAVSRETPKPRRETRDTPTQFAFTQTAHTLVPANLKDLMSVRPNSEVAKRTIVPISAAMVTREHLGAVTFTGGAYGDETVATANATDAYGPKNLTEALAYPGTPNSVVPSEAVSGGQAITSIADYTSATTLNEPRGYIAPDEPYGPAPVSPTDDPTITSLAPNTATVANGVPIWVAITGTKFTVYSSVETGNVYTPYSKYRSPTRIDVLMDPRSSVGTIVVKVIDHGVKSNGSNFTFT